MTLTDVKRHTAAEYDEAIAALQQAKTQLEPDGRDCAVCGDSGHQAWECHHNSLAVMHDWQVDRLRWRCFHCGELFKTEEAAREHFGPKSADKPVCQRDLDEPVEPENIWGEDAKYLREDWRSEVFNGDTNLGYWDWVESCRENADPEEEPKGTNDPDEAARPELRQ